MKKIINKLGCFCLLFIATGLAAFSQEIKTSSNDIPPIIVDQNGKGDFLTIQAAVNATPAFPYERIVILIKNGIYNEKVSIPAWNPKVTLIGESREKTIISYNDYFSKINLGRNSTFSTYTLLVDGDDFIAQNLTIQNSAGEVGQAVALHLNSNGSMFVNCSFLGNQDTVYLSGDGSKNYFKNCYIEGTTDFIFGEATVLFENCVIHSKKDSFITAASTPQNTAFGFVFKECKLTADDGVTQVYLGRPWRIYAKTVFMNCEMGNHIIPEAWGNWSKPEAEKTTLFAEYTGKGAGFQPQKRVRWSFQLTASQAQEYSNSAILGDLFYNNCMAFLKDVESNKYIK